MIISKKKQLKIISGIARKLPKTRYHTYSQSKLPKKKWVSMFFSFLFTLKWRNGEFIFAGWLVEWINIKWLGAHKHDANHYRRMKRAYQRDGSKGVYRYLSNLGVHPDLLKHWTKGLV